MSMEETAGSPPIGTTDAPGPGTPHPGLPSRMIGVLFSPGATFTRIAERPSWLGALAAYLVIVAAATMVYSLNVDWEAMLRSSFEGSVGWKLMTSIMSESQLAEIERTSLNEILSVGRGGLALSTTLNSVIGTVVLFHFMAVLFATLFYLMGSLADLKLGRVYLDAFFCVLLFILFAIVNFTVRAAFGEDGRAALPYQSGLTCLFFLGYFWLFRRSVERQPDLRRLVASYAHAMAVPALAMIVMVIVIFIKQEPVTVTGDQVVMSSLGGILGYQGSSPLAVLLGAIDIFQLWGLIAASIGFAAATRLSMGTAAAITFLPWGFYTMARLAMSAAFGG